MKTTTLISMAALALASGAAGAITPLEQKVLDAPMPHHQLASGATVKVHYVRHHTDMEDHTVFTQAVANLKLAVDACVLVKSKQGQASNPPRVWPDLDHGIDVDSYWARNRSIIYKHGYGAVINPQDCSLKELESWTATLSSSKGSCKIDLIRKTAEGQCDANGAADAPVYPAPPANKAAAMQAQIARMAADPRTAAAAAQLQAMAAAGPVPTGQKKTVLGYECAVWSSAKPAVTYCMARGATFNPPHSINSDPNDGVQLEFLQKGVSTRATEAKFDADVSSAIFTPYLAAGYTIKREGQE